LVGILIGIVAIASYFTVATKLLENQTRLTEIRGRTVVIFMTTRQWRFDVVNVTPPGSVQFSSNPPTGQFANTTIIVQKGDTIILRIKDLDVPHGFGLPEFGVNAVTPPGEVTEVTFVASSTGKFTFFCTVFCGSGHPEHKGTLIVTG
jgi:cytochrome c oxidase subunit 2